MRKIVITGAAGFIGSHITEKVHADFPEAKIVVLDKMTYAADIRNLMPLLDSERIELVVGDICDFSLASRVLERTDLLIHAAAESHVDNSFGNSLQFTMTNVYGTHSLLEAARLQNVSHIVHVSTDEVYGQVIEGESREDSPFNPTNPYSASKASAEMIVTGYLNCYGMPIKIIRGNNVFGIRQFPEKIIPKFILLLHFGLKLPLHGTGLNTRHYISAVDFADATMALIEKGEFNEIYNVGSHDEHTNREVARMICDAFGRNFDSSIMFVEDRPFNDARYAIDTSKIESLGWRPIQSLTDELTSIVDWYRFNAERYRSAMEIQ